MRATVIGHAGLFIEGDGTTLLVDPWLSGSCYWRSWWHYPPSAEVRDEWLEPGFVYLTHHHFDHFHYPSLRRIHRSTKVLIPRFGVDVMRGELDRLGFHDVTEMNHSETLRLTGGLSVTSYQYGFDDSALVVVGPSVVIFNLNDCKLRAPELAQLRDAGQDRAAQGWPEHRFRLLDAAFAVGARLLAASRCGDPSLLVGGVAASRRGAPAAHRSAAPEGLDGIEDDLTLHHFGTEPRGAG